MNAHVHCLRVGNVQEVHRLRLELHIRGFRQRTVSQPDDVVLRKRKVLHHLCACCTFHRDESSMGCPRTRPLLGETRRNGVRWRKTDKPRVCHLNRGLAARGVNCWWSVPSWEDTPGPRRQRIPSHRSARSCQNWGYGSQRASDSRCVRRPTCRALTAGAELGVCAFKIHKRCISTASNPDAPRAHGHNVRLTYFCLRSRDGICSP